MDAASIVSIIGAVVAGITAILAVWQKGQAKQHRNDARRAASRAQASADIAQEAAVPPHNHYMHIHENDDDSTTGISGTVVNSAASGNTPGNAGNAG